MFTPQEKAKCVLWMAELKSPTLVQRQFRTTFHKEPPTRRDLYAWTKKFEGTGSVLKEHTGGRTRSEDDVERIRCAFGSSPRKSIRCASAELQIPRSTVHRVARKQQPLQGVGETILVLSGKGGVGKSTVSVQLATSLNALGYRVGILDIDLCGPSVPRMVGVEGQDVLTSPDGKWLPVAVNDQKTLSVISLAFFLESKNDAVIWRGPKKNAMIKQLLRNVAWKVDFLIIDTPPGTSDEHISILENLSECRVKGAVLVTTPQMVAVDDVTRELTFCRRTGMNVLGIIENMSGFVCPNCSECSNILATGGGEQLAKKSSVPFLGRIPIDPSLVKCLEEGENYSEKFPTSQVALVYKSIAENLSKDTMEIDC